MYFKRLEIHGFKSFAEPVTIEFHKGITCVVGPNGSGKSNVCDAIRWVLGAQSAKMLRGDRMEDVIFAGTASRKSRGMAEVTLVIDNSTGILPIAYNEVAITRRMYRSGESEYLINNNPCRMRDIRELIMDTGIGVEGYSIIGQGKIADIISNNTESIREILEETAGIVMYRSKKADAERKLSAATSNVERVNDIIGEIEGRIDGLREDSIKATEYLKLKDRYQQLEVNITLSNIETIERKSEHIRDDMAELRRDMEEKQKGRDALAQSAGEIGRRREELDLQIEVASAEHLEAVEEVNSLISQGEISHERLSAIAANHKRLKEEIRELTEKIVGEEENKEALLVSREEVDRRLEEKEGALAEKIWEHEELERKLAEKKRELDEKKNAIFTMTGRISERDLERKSLESLKENLENRRASLLRERGEGETSRSDEAAALETAEREHKAAVEELAGERNRQEERKARREEIRREEGELRRETTGLTMEMERLSARKKTIEEMENNYEGYSGGVKFIMNAAVPGVNGVVAELIQVPKGYETAIETALGVTMQNIVCEDDISAKVAIQKLKESRGGRLTFLPLESLRAREVLRHEGVEEEAGFKGYGVEIVSCEEKYRKAVDYLLGNLIVMENMDRAVATSKKLKGPFKIVTLEGEIINGGGTITGGRYKHKSANILERRREIRTLGELLREKTSAREESEQKLSEMKGELSRLEEVIAEGEEIVRETERRVMTGENEIRMLIASLDALEIGREKREKELEDIDREQEESGKAIEKIQREVEKGREAAELLERELEEEEKVFREEEAVADALEDVITEERVALGGETGERSKVEALISRTEDQLSGYRREKESKENSLKEQLAEQEEIQSRHENNASLIGEKEKTRDRLQESLGKLREEKQQLNRTWDEKNRQKEAMETQLNILQSGMVELEIKKAKGETQLENARNKLWEEFELSYMQAIDFKEKEFVLSSGIKENREIKSRIRELGDVNVGAIEEYASVSERYEFLTEQRGDILVSMDELKKLIEQMDRTIRSKFKESFDRVTDNFEKVFQELYGGGEARIMLSDESNPFDSEIEIIAQPPGKQLKHINLLSGGEKTMTAIALMFAVLKTKPTPCCILDEVEAALDDSNLNIFGRYLRNFDGVQFTLITHQKATMEHADVMYGITMPESGVSKIYSLEMGDSPLM